jgi:ubiquitin carboxyl-terminal hydrolase 7
MRDTPVSGTYSNLFEGESENVFECTNVDVESVRKETFNCLQLSIEGNRGTTIEESIQKYVSSEDLTGENQYETEFHGK